MTVLEIILALVFGALVVLAAAYRASSRQTSRRLQILYDIALVADGGRSLGETLDAIATILVPALGDFCMIDVIEEGRVRRAAVRVDGPGAKAIEKGLAERKPALQEQLADAASTARQEPRFFERVTEEDLRPVAENEEDLRFLLAMKIRSFVTVELRARGRPTGVLSIGVSHSGRRLRQDDAHFAAVLAGRVALALDNAGLFSDLERSERERAEIAETLQRGLLRTAAPAHPRLVGGGDVPARWGRERSRRGLLRCLPGRRGLDAGDRRRHRPRRPGRLGHRQRPLHASHRRHPHRRSRRRPRNPQSRTACPARAALCSVAAMAIDEDPAQPNPLAIAGHPPPLLIDGDSVVEVTVPAPVLGAFEGACWRIEEVRVRPGQQLVIVTDGITEALGPQGRFGEDRLHAELAGVASPALAAQKLEGAL